MANRAFHKDISNSELLHLREQGLSNKQIAERVGVHVTTIITRIGKQPSEITRRDRNEKITNTPVGEKVEIFKESGDKRPFAWQCADIVRKDPDVVKAKEQAVETAPPVGAPPRREHKSFSERMAEREMQKEGKMAVYMHTHDPRDIPQDATVAEIAEAHGIEPEVPQGIEAFACEHVANKKTPESLLRDMALLFGMNAIKNYVIMRAYECGFSHRFYEASDYTRMYRELLDEEAKGE